MSGISPNINAELANYSATHVFVGPQAVADYATHSESGQMPPEEVNHKVAVLLHIDSDSEGVTIQGVVDGAADTSPEAQSAAREYHNDYRDFVGQLRKVHASGTSMVEIEGGIIKDTAKEMAKSDLHLLGGYVAGKAERTGVLISSLFFHKIFSDAYKRGILASINATGFDIRRLPPDEQQRIEAMARLEDTRETTLGSSALIASMMMPPAQAFSQILVQ